MDGHGRRPDGLRLSGASHACVPDRECSDFSVKPAGATTVTRPALAITVRRSRSTATTCHDSFASCDVVLSDTRARPDARRASDNLGFHATTLASRCASNMSPAPNRRGVRPPTSLWPHATCHRRDDPSHPNPHITHARWRCSLLLSPRPSHAKLGS